MSFVKKYVYVIKDSYKLTKIGYSRDVYKRLTALNQVIPYRLDLVYYKLYNNARDIEKGLHEIFNHKRYHGEWFVLSDDDIVKLKGFMDNPSTIPSIGPFTDDCCRHKATCFRLSDFTLMTLDILCKRLNLNRSQVIESLIDQRYST